YTRQVFFFSSRRRHTRLVSDWSSDVCSSDLARVRHVTAAVALADAIGRRDHVSERSGRQKVHARRVTVVRIEHRANAEQPPHLRSEERRVGKEWRTAWAAEP